MPTPIPPGSSRADFVSGLRRFRPTRATRSGFSPSATPSLVAIALTPRHVQHCPYVAAATFTPLSTQDTAKLVSALDAALEPLGYSSGAKLPIEGKDLYGFSLHSMNRTRAEVVFDTATHTISIYDYQNPLDPNLWVALRKRLDAKLVLPLASGSSSSVLPFTPSGVHSHSVPSAPP